MDSKEKWLLGVTETVLLPENVISLTNFNIPLLKFQKISDHNYFNNVCGLVEYLSIVSDWIHMKSSEKKCI